MQIDCNTEQGGMQINDSLFVDFGKEALGAGPSARDPVP